MALNSMQLTESPIDQHMTPDLTKALGVHFHPCHFYRLYKGRRY
jgi:hypothetical protein